MKTTRFGRIVAPLFLLAQGLLQPGLSMAQGADNPRLPDIDRRAATMVSGVIVEPAASWPLALPAPGPSTKTPLLPQAEAARQRGLKAAGLGDWPAAVAAFKEASKLAYASPPLMFNLALAYQRGGWPVQAAMYYRAYLAALPAAPNAAEIRAQIPKLIAETETRALREFDEAERLADKLPATAPVAGTKSLRQSALEGMSGLAFLGGMSERGEALQRKALALPGAIKADDKEYPDRHGLYAAAFSRDIRRVDEIVAKFGTTYTPERIFNHRTYALAQRGEWDRLRRVVEAFPAGLLSGDNIGSKDAWMKRTGAFEVVEIKHGLNLDAAKELYVGTLLSDTHTLFWRGRPDIAQRMARRAVEHYRKFNPAGSQYPRWDYVSILIPNAVLGDRPAIMQEMARWDAHPLAGQRTADILDKAIIEVAALYLFASMAPADAEATLMAMLNAWANGIAASTKIRLPQDRWHRNFPEAYFALAVVKGDSAAALKYLANDDPPTNPDYETRAWRALRFAIATGRSQLAFEIAETLPPELGIFFELNRLAAHPAASEAVRERVRRYGAAMSGGWRPADADHANAAWRHLKNAIDLNDEKQYGVLPADAEQTAKEKPEKLPYDLAAHAVVLWMGAMAARVED